MKRNEWLTYDDNSRAYVNEQNVVHVHDAEEGEFVVKGFPSLEEAWDFLMIADFRGEDFIELKNPSYKLEWVRAE